MLRKEKTRAKIEQNKEYLNRVNRNVGRRERMKISAKFISIN